MREVQALGMMIGVLSIMAIAAFTGFGESTIGTIAITITLGGIFHLFMLVFSEALKLLVL
jgi:hypothetical protein